MLASRRRKRLVVIDVTVRLKLYIEDERMGKKDLGSYYVDVYLVSTSMGCLQNRQ
jgi:hypothetical protein